jgi:nucleoside-diphosphate-sugar epimerase
VLVLYEFGLSIQFKPLNLQPMVFVTGGTGLLGTHVLIELTGRGHAIRALYRDPSKIRKAETIFNHYLGESSKKQFSKIEWVEGDILDIVSLEEAMKGCDAVYHCAAMVSFRKRDFKRLMKINKEGTANVVNVALDKGVTVFCHVSSTATIGKSTEKDIQDESNKWVKKEGTSNYAISKYSSETEVWRGSEEGLNVVIVNPSVIFGAGDWNEGSLSIFKVVKKGLKFYTPGANAFVDARDVAFALCELAERKIYKERFLVFSENRAYRSVFDEMASVFKVKPPHIETKKWMAGIAWRIEGILAFLFGKKQNITKETAHSAMTTTVFSNEKIKERIGMEFIPIDQSIKDTVDYLLSKEK